MTSVLDFVAARQRRQRVRGPVRHIDDVDRRAAEALGQIKAARIARDAMDLPRQREASDAALALLEEGLTHPDALAYARAGTYAVDARSEVGEHHEARRLADRVRDLVRDVAGKESLAALVIQRAQAHAIDLAGDPTDATARLMGLNFEVGRTIGVELAVRVEQLAILQAAATAARHAGDRRSAARAATAAERGEQVARQLEGRCPAAVSLYRQRFGLLSSWAGDDQHATIERLEWSRTHREATSRNRASIKTIDGEILYLSGQHREATRVFVDAIHAFEPRLPRKANTLRAMLAERQLAA